jgi:hypothetical protein
LDQKELDWITYLEKKAASPEGKEGAEIMQTDHIEEPPEFTELDHILRSEHLSDGYM